MQKIAVVHDWLTVYTGSERVLEQILLVYPQADIFSLVDFLPPERREFLRGKTPRTSFLQHLPLARQKYRQYLPLMPLAIEQFDLSDYSIVISSSHAVAKGVLTSPDQLHISYIYSPMRYAWDMQHSYLAESGLNSGLKSWLVRALLHYIRMWDVRTINNPDAILACSQHIAKRIWKIYRRKSTVIYPPVDISTFPFCDHKDNYYLVVSRLVQYKRIDLIVETFATMPDRRLIVIGEGPEAKKLTRPTLPNVEFLGYQPTEIVSQYMQKARAFVFAALEDFGIVLLEAQACGTPVIAFGKGGPAEIVNGLDSSSPTGILYKEQTVPALQSAILQFETNNNQITPKACRENALRYTPEKFRSEFSTFVENEWELFTKLNPMVVY